MSEINMLINIGAGHVTSVLISSSPKFFFFEFFIEKVSLQDEPGESAFVKSRWDHFENSEQKLGKKPIKFKRTRFYVVIFIKGRLRV